MSRMYAFSRAAFCGFALVSLVLSAASPSSALAGPPHVHFDAAYSVACRDVTPQDFAHANPLDRLIEARIDISALVKSGREDDLAEYYYLLRSPQHTLQIHDYLPKTTLASDIDGAITIEQKDERSGGLGISLAGIYAGAAKATGDANIGAKRSKTVRFDKLPPLESLTASGTIDRGTGVFFKLRPSSRTSLEGGHEFVLLMRVPVEWRADHLLLECRATGWRRGPVRALDERADAGRANFLIALYLEGDGAARDAALELISAEGRLRGAAAEIAPPKAPATLAGRLGLTLHGGDSGLPTDWLERLLGRPSRSEVRMLMPQLPPTVREAAMRYFVALARLETINETGSRPVAAIPGGKGVATHLE